MPKPNTYGISTVLRTIAVLLGVLVVLTLAVAQIVTPKATAAPNTYLNFQARLRTSSGSLVPDGNYNIEFKIYDAASNGNLLWTETRTGSDKVRVANGYFTVSLGSVNPFPGTIPWGEQLWLTMNVGGTGGSPSWDGEMDPRLQLTAVPHAFHADNASGISQVQGGNTGTLGFTTLTGNRNILLPDASGTVCLQGSSACGFISSSDISDPDALLLQGGNSFGSAMTIGTNDNYGVNIEVNGNTVASFSNIGEVLFKNATNSTAAFDIQASNGTSILKVDSTTQRVTLGHFHTYNFDSMTNLFSPLNPGGALSEGVAWSSDGQYVAQVIATSPYIKIFKRSGDTFTELSGPADLPAGRAYGVDWSPDGTYLSVAHATSPYITIYKRSGDTFTKLSNPADLPTQQGEVVAWSPDGQYMVVGAWNTGLLRIYKRSGDTFTKLADPATMPAGVVRGAEFSSDGTYLALATSNSPYIYIYKRSGDTFTKLSNPSSLPGSAGMNVAWSPNTEYVTLALNSSPYFAIYKRSGDTFTKITDPPSLPSSQINETAWSPDSTYLSLAHNGSPYVTTYKRSGDTFTKLSNPANLPPGDRHSIEFSEDGMYLAVGGTAQPNLTIYKASTLVTLAPAARLQLASGTTPEEGIAFGTSINLYQSDAAMLTLSSDFTIQGEAVLSTVSGAGLTDCKDAGNDKLLWDADTKTFSCGTDASGVLSIGTIDTQSKSANGAVISGTSIYLQTADGTYPGLVSTGVQTFAGNKTFSGDLAIQGEAILTTVSGAGLTDCDDANDKLIYDASTKMFGCGVDGSGGMTGGVTTVGTIDTQSKSANGAVISGTSIYLQTADGSYPGLVSTGAQTFAGTKTFTGGINIQGTTSGTDYLDLTVTMTGTSTSSGAYFYETVAPSSASTAAYTGLGISISSSSANMDGELKALYINSEYTGTSNSVDSLKGIQIQNEFNGTGTTIASAIGLEVLNPSGSNGTITNNVGIFVQNQTRGANDYGVYIEGADTYSLYVASGTSYFGGQVTIGTSDTTGTLLVLDTKTNAGDPTGTNGAMYYNSNAGKFRCYEGGAWKNCIDTGSAGISTVGTFSGSSLTNGASISGNTITFGPADTANPGMVSVGSQTFGGAKTFYDDVTVLGTGTDRLTVGNAYNGGARLNYTGAGQSGDQLTLYGFISGSIHSSVDFNYGNNGTQQFSIYNNWGGYNILYHTMASRLTTLPGSLDLASGSTYLINGADINTAGTLTNVAYENQANNFTLANTFSAAGTALTVTNNASIGGTLGVGGQLTVGTSDTTGTLLVLDTKTNSGDPTGTNGAMYYNSNAGKFRCYEGGSWKNCIDTGSSGITSVGTIDSASKSANGAVISGSSIILQNADASYPGLVSTGSQTFAGAKTFNDGLTVTGTSDAILDINRPSTGSGAVGIRFGNGGGLLWAMYAPTSSTDFRLMNSATFEDVLGISQTGQASFKNSSNSTSAFQILNASSISLFTIDSSNNRIYVGNTSADTTGVVLILDTKTSSGDPTGVDGAMYYNATYGSFRCYSDGWRFCSDPASLAWSYSFIEDFIGVGWQGTIGQNAMHFFSQGTNSGYTKVSSTSSNRPGVVSFSTGTTSSGNAGVSTGMGQDNEDFILAGGEVLEFSIYVETLSTNTQEYDLRLGFCDIPWNSDCVDGAFFEYDRNSSTNWRAVNVNNSTRSSVLNTGVAVSTGWWKFTIKVNSNATAIDYYINGNHVGTISTQIPTSRATGLTFIIQKSAGSTARSFYIDYIYLRSGTFSTNR